MVGIVRIPIFINSDDDVVSDGLTKNESFLSIFNIPANYLYKNLLTILEILKHPFVDIIVILRDFVLTNNLDSGFYG